jgi:hypothetical protein
MKIAGEGGRTLAEVWGSKPRAYLGMSVPGFPSLFLLYGPNTGGGAGSVIYTIEAAVRHVISALDALERADAQRIEIRQQVADVFDAELRAALAGTVWHTGCTNWYVDENGHDPNQWPWTLRPTAAGPRGSTQPRTRCTAIQICQVSPDGSGCRHSPRCFIDALRSAAGRSTRVVAPRRRSCSGCREPIDGVC